MSHFFNPKLKNFSTSRTIGLLYSWGGVVDLSLLFSGEKIFFPESGLWKLFSYDFKDYNCVLCVFMKEETLFFL